MLSQSNIYNRLNVSTTQFLQTIMLLIAWVSTDIFSVLFNSFYSSHFVEHYLQLPTFIIFILLLYYGIIHAKYCSDHNITYVILYL